MTRRINLERLRRWDAMERVVRSEECSICRRKTGVRFDEEELGFICRVCWMHGNRCSCGSGLPVVLSVGRCRTCYIDEEIPVFAESRVESALARCSELIDGPGLGHGKNSNARFRRKLSRAMQKNGIDFDGPKDVVRSCFVFGGMSGERRRRGLLWTGDPDE